MMDRVIARQIAFNFDAAPDMVPEISIRTVREPERGANSRAALRTLRAIKAAPEACEKRMPQNGAKTAIYSGQ
jgi:hypothetical protein